MNPLSVVIITKNEAKNIERCLKSVAWADEIVVADSGSTDGTVEICRAYRCRTVQAEWAGFGPVKKLAVNAAGHDWIFSIDADEEVTPALRTEIERILRQPDFDGYEIRRTSFYLGRMIRHCGWNRDYPLRLFNRRLGNFNDRLVHEFVVLRGSKGRIEAPLLHYTYPTLSTHISKMDRYSELGAETLLQKGKHGVLSYAILSGVAKFIKMYLLQAGFLDGKAGLILSLNSAFGVYLKYVKLWEKKH